MIPPSRPWVLSERVCCPPTQDFRHSNSSAFGHSVRPMTINETIEVRCGIIVAHDGSSAATAALQTAVRCTPAFGSRIEVVRAWTLGTAEGPSDLGAGYIPSYEEFERTTLAALQSDVAAVRADHPEIEISCSVVHGGAATKLIDASSDVDLIVVASRGHGGFAGLLLGSVSDQIVHHARCRVLVDRGPGVASPEAEQSRREEMESALASELKLGEPA